MRNHLSLAQIALALGVAETYAGQAWEPALTKAALVFRRYPTEFLRLLSERIAELEAAEARQPPKAMSGAELAEQRRRRMGGRPCATAR